MFQERRTAALRSLQESVMVTSPPPTEVRSSTKRRASSSTIRGDEMVPSSKRLRQSESMSEGTVPANKRMALPDDYKDDQEHSAKRQRQE